MHARLPAHHPPALADAPIGQRPQLAFRYDLATRIIRVTGTETWTLDDIDVHFAELAVLIDRVRAQNGVVSALVDLSRAPAQSPEVVARIHHATGRLYRPADRVALVVPSFPLKAELERLAWHDNTAIFVAAPAAESWLSATPSG